MDGKYLSWFAASLLLPLLRTPGTLAFHGRVPTLSFHQLDQHRQVWGCKSRTIFLPIQSCGRSRRSTTHAVPGADIEQPPIDASESPIVKALSKADAASELSSMARGKVNEIDFCIAPADVSLSRAYGIGTSSTTSAPLTAGTTTTIVADPPLLSLTRALNNASNRAVRRILLARSWPSAEALNLSLRRAAAAEKERERGAASLAAAGGGGNDDGAMMKCPVPRPILNVLTRKRDSQRASDNYGGGRQPTQSQQPQQPAPRSRTDAEYVADQIQSFRDRYGELSGYQYAEAYLESILSLATAGIESPRVQEVLQAGIYDESYRRVIGVLRSVGVQLERDLTTGQNRIATKLIDQDICLSMLDKIRLRNEPAPAPPTAAETASDTTNTAEKEGSDATEVAEETKPRRHKLWQKEKVEESEVDEEQLTKEDLGGVLLSSEEPSMTRQLNVLSNIVQRALLFGGDEELLVLAETLEADRAAFVDRWYPETGGLSESVSSVRDEPRPGVQFLNCLVQLLRDCYDNGVVTNLDPPLPLSQSYANAYERLVATAVELGSGYLKPVAGNVISSMPKPRTAQEELGRFAVWESTFRQTNADTGTYPEDMEGVWEVRDEIGGETIGKSLVYLGSKGAIKVDPPLEGLRWRLDPGPTHLDTCTFQVLSSDGTILQYRGFIDRGARLEARFSKRPIKIRGSVMFQMRDGSVDYYKDMLPINYRTGTTKFVMTKKEESR